jgi:hypothetical protein
MRMRACLQRCYCLASLLLLLAAVGCGTRENQAKIYE